MSSPVTSHGIPRRHTFQRFLAVFLIVFGALFAVLIVATPSDPKNPEGERVVLVMGVMMLVGGAIWRWRIGASDDAQREGFEEKAILGVAARYGGRATLAQIALETQLSMEQAETAINRLCGRNVAQPDLLDDGSVVYLFGMLGSAELDRP
jgi:hypothetical protein